MNNFHLRVDQQLLEARPFGGGALLREGGVLDLLARRRGRLGRVGDGPG